MAVTVVKALDQQKVLAVIKTLTDRAKNIKPHVILGDEDSIDLTSRQKGRQDGLREAATLIYDQLLEHQ